ncbi:nucleotide disphospho-sugar-binding domain-containing protein [Streptomyces sp. NPDC093094]|uniref:nucleotide disphospho-sugar-binding domain-containing protein n=1 Tax=Streptomyces sp. NPDC093094 TaxID=3366026 RepID=UPI00381123B3
MRVLLVTPSSPDRLHHLVPLAWALRTSGHAVQIAARPAFTDAVTATGLVAVAVGEDTPGEREGSPDARLAAPADVEGLTAHGGRWRPRLVLWDAAAPAGATAAGLLGAAHVRVDGPFDPAPPGAGADTDAGEPPHGTLDCLPPSLRPAGAGEPGADGPRALSVRPVPYDGPKVIPVWLRRTPRVRRVHVAADVPDEAVPALFEAAAGLDAELLFARPADRVPPGVRLPSQVRLLDSVPAAVLPSCTAVVHGGGTALAVAALAHGLPQLVLTGAPAGHAGPADGIVARLAHLGAAAVTGPAHLDAGVLREIAGDSPLRARAALLGRETAALPTPRDIVPELTGLAADR